MENYDVSFASQVASLRPQMPASTATRRSGGILVSGFNFGTGSSREQAATALKHAGIPLVVCGSFGDIFKRNSINNGLICVESPELVNELTAEFALDGVRGKGGKDGEGTVRPGWEVEVDMKTALLTVTKASGASKTYKIGRVGKSVQEIVRHPPAGQSWRPAR
jgi:homoaconitate hydratase